MTKPITTSAWQQYEDGKAYKHRIGLYETVRRNEHDDRFVQACHKLDYTEYLVDTLIGGDSYERTEVIDMMLTDGKLAKLQRYLKKVRKEEHSIGEQTI